MRSRSVLLGVAALLLSACAGPEDSPKPATASEAAIHNPHDVSLYFRCGATGWKLDQATRMEQVPGAPGVFAITYDVTSGSMTIDGDRCVVTETEREERCHEGDHGHHRDRNHPGGGDDCDHGHRGHHPHHQHHQADYRSATSPVVVPAGGALVRVRHEPRKFRVLYPSLGTYVMTVDWTNKTFTVASATPPPVTVQPTLDVRVGATDAAAHLRLVDAVPSPGLAVRHLPPVSDAITVTADGHPLAWESVFDPTSVDTLIQYEVPAGTQGLQIEYDQLDAALPYEGEWFLELAPVSGPRHVAIHLPADAVIDRTNHADDDAAPAELAYDLTEGETVTPFVAYLTPNTPDLYDHLETTRFEVSLPIAQRRYQPQLLGLLENLDALFRSYTGQDVRRIQGVGRYPFAFPPGGWKWGGVSELGGGLSVKGFSTVNARLVPGVTLPVDLAPITLVAITAHELGNGWWGAWEEPDLSNHTPLWINNEGHSSFLRSEAEVDLGYCADAQGEYAGKYQLVQSCAFDVCTGEYTVVILTSLRAHYGWGPLQAFYAAVQDRNTFQLRGLSEVERSSAVIGFFSQQVGEDLAPFFDAFGVPITQQVRDEMSTRPAAAVPIIDHLECRPPALRVANVPVQVWLPAGEAGSLAAYACAPGGFTATLPPIPGLTLLEVPATSNCGTVTIAVDPAHLNGEPAALTVSADGLPGSPAVVPLNVNVVSNVAADPGFDVPLGSPWSEVGFISLPGLFDRDTTVLRAGMVSGASARIDSPTDNDARLVQTVAVTPQTMYRLTAWVRTENVAGGLGANLTVEWPGPSWVSSRSLFGTNDWQQVSLDVPSGSSTSFDIEMRLGHYGAISHGRVWFDDVQLLPLGPQ